MTSPSNRQFDDQLHAYHMGWLDRAESEAVERLIASSPELAVRSRLLAGKIEPLADWDSLPAVEDLEAQVLHRVQRETGAALVPVTDAIHMSPVPAGRERRLRSPFSLKELLTVAASLAVIFTVVVPSLGKASALAQRHACAENLRDIGSALRQYGLDHADQLPYAGELAFAGNWLPASHSGVSRMRNSRNRFLLLSGGYVNSSARFVCPADEDALVMRYDDLAWFDDFAESRNCSYDSQIMFGGGQPIGVHPLKVVYSDSNPIFDGQEDLTDDPARLNSAVHRGLSGQNIVRMDGAVSWATSPNVGVQQDNIWQIGGRPIYAGYELPELATDSFMIP